MVFQRAACLVAGHNGASATLKEQGSGARGLQCFFRGRRDENPVVNDGDLKKQNIDANISVLSTNDVGTDIDSSMDALTHSESVDGFLESPADGFLATLSPLVEITTFHSTFHSEAQFSDLSPAEEAPVDEARLLAVRAREAFLARKQRHTARASLSEKDLEVPRAELAQPLLVRQLAERLRQEAASRKR